MKRQVFVTAALLLSVVTTMYSQGQELRPEPGGTRARSSKFTRWSTPINLGPTINSTANDLAAALSRDERSLYFSSKRLGYGDEDIWVSHRNSRYDEWGEPVNLGPMINSSAIERVRYLSPDGHLLLFQSDRPGGFGGTDIWASSRRRISDDFGWEPPVNLGSVINTGDEEIGVAFLLRKEGLNGRLYFASDRPGGFGSADFYSSEIMSDGSFSSAIDIVELSSPQHDSCLTLTSDDLEIIFTSRRPDPLDSPTSADLWSSTRTSIYEPWSPPVNLGATVNARGYQDCCPSLSFDGKTLLFTSTRPGGFGGQDIYMTTRELRKGNQ